MLICDKAQAPCTCQLTHAKSNLPSSAGVAGFEWAPGTLSGLTAACNIQQSRQDSAGTTKLLCFVTLRCWTRVWHTFPNRLSRGVPWRPQEVACVRDIICPLASSRKQLFLLGNKVHDGSRGQELRKHTRLLFLSSTTICGPETRLKN